MAEIKKLSPEKAPEKIRSSDQEQSTGQRRDDKMDALNEEIKRMKAQRMRLDRKRD